MNKFRTKGDVGLDGMYLGEVIGQVLSTGRPCEFELLLGDSVFNPEVSEVHGTGALGLGRAVEDVDSDEIVRYDEGGALWVAKKLKGVSKGDGQLCVNEYGAELCFGCGGDDDVDDGCDVFDTAVGG